MNAINWYLPQYGVATKANIPPAEEVQDGRLYRIPYDFPGVLANATGQNFTAPGQPFLMWAFTYSITGGTGAGFQFNCYHRHGSFERRLDQTMVVSANALGTAQQPAFLKSPYLIDMGEVLGFELRSLEPANTVDIQIVIWGALMPYLPPVQVPR